MGDENNCSSLHVSQRPVMIHSSHQHYQRSVRSRSEKRVKRASFEELPSRFFNSQDEVGLLCNTKTVVVEEPSELTLGMFMLRSHPMLLYSNCAWRVNAHFSISCDEFGVKACAIEK